LFDEDELFSLRKTENEERERKKIITNVIEIE
jgi:hypothetical protein